MAAILPLNPYLLESPQKVATQLKKKAFNQNLLSKICYIATAAIFAATFALSYLITPTPAISLLLLVSILFTAFYIFPKAGKLQERAREYTDQSKLEALVAKKLEEIKDLDVEEFFKKNLPGKDLPKIGDLKMLLPLIARHLVQKERADKLYQEFCEAGKNQDDAIASYNISLKSDKYIKVGRPAAFNAAWLLRVIANPFLQGRSYEEYGTVRETSPPIFVLKGTNFFKPFENTASPNSLASLLN